MQYSLLKTCMDRRVPVSAIRGAVIAPAIQAVRRCRPSLRPRARFRCPLLYAVLAPRSLAVGKSVAKRRRHPQFAFIGRTTVRGSRVTHHGLRIAYPLQESICTFRARGAFCTSIWSLTWSASQTRKQNHNTRVAPSPPVSRQTDSIIG